MAKYRKKNYKYYKKGRWSANIANITNELTIDGIAGPFYTSILLTQNPIQTTTTVSQQYTVKNIELNATIETQVVSGNIWIEELAIYIMYVPQGMNITQNYAFEHPEYIMAYRYIGTPQIDHNPNYIIPKIKTRLSRRLQTGDSIIAFVTGTNDSEDQHIVDIRGIVRWWTKAN